METVTGKKGKIIKGVGGAYTVHVPLEDVTYECTAKGIFRYKNEKPLIGDDVIIEVTDDSGKKANIVTLCGRKNELIRPAVANIDQALVVFAMKKPAPNFNLLDKFLVMMESVGIKTVICFNKVDLADSQGINYIRSIYAGTGYEFIMTSTLDGTGIDDVKRCMRGKTTAFAGPSGVGKSSMLNAIMPGANSKTGDVSLKIERGKHTTRHTEIYNVGDDTYVMDTPGFSSMYSCGCEKEELRYYFPEFGMYEGKCRYNGCVHISEPDCSVKSALAAGKISAGRYENYVLLYNEIKSRRKY